VRGSAELSADGRYRYRLTRSWHQPGPFATFVMLNPSTADASINDATIRRCIGYGQRWGCGGLLVVNLYAFRARNPEDLWTQADPVGPENDTHLARAARGALLLGAPLVAAWGVNARADRVVEFRELVGMAHLTCLGKTRAGAPRHPLYCRADAGLKEWP
jgi:hypothetical protein